jgi:hypothetical protein
MTPEQELEDFYRPSEDTKRRAAQALQDYDDYRRFKMPPNAGGLGDQPAEWVEAVRCVMEAKEWSEALVRLRSEYKQATSGEAEHQDQDRIDEVGGELGRLQAAHDERIERMRTYWKG